MRERRIASVGLTMLNDAITRIAAARRLPVIDLRLIFSEAGDYANSIEPSAQGAEKIAARIVRVAAEHDFTGPASFYA
jgi:hypothetical protein